VSALNEYFDDGDSCPECGSPFDKGCGAQFHDFAPTAPDWFNAVEHASHMGDKAYRYRVIEVWGDAPEQITGLLNNPDGSVVDYWRGVETTWEVMDFSGKEPKPKYGWAGEYCGVLVAVSDSGEPTP
jgi:hypothetical protein